MGDTGDLAGRSVLVTGASGFIGSHLCRALNRFGAVVHGVARNSAPSNAPEVLWHEGDLSDSSFVQELFHGLRPELVFHLASHVSGSRDMELVLPTLQGNLVTAVHVLREATEVGCRRIVMAGSMEEPDSPPTPPSPYAAAKWAATGYARMFHALYGTPVALARIFMVYGPEQRDTLKLVPYVIQTLLRGGSPALGSGVRPVDWIYVDDVVDGLLRMGAGHGPPAQPLDLGSGKLTTIRSVVEEIERQMDRQGKCRFEAVPDRPMERVRVADVEASSKSLGWRASVNLQEGLRATIEWYRERESGVGGSAP